MYPRANKGLRANRRPGEKKFCPMNEISKAVSTNELLFTAENAEVF